MGRWHRKGRIGNSRPIRWEVAERTAVSEKVAPRAESQHSRPVIRTVVSGEVVPRARSQKLTSYQAATENTEVRRKAESGVKAITYELLTGQPRKTVR